MIRSKKLRPQSMKIDLKDLQEHVINPKKEVRNLRKDKNFYFDQLNCFHVEIN